LFRDEDDTGEGTIGDTGIDDFFGGFPAANEPAMPSRPRFMMLAGVTGVSCGRVAGDGGTAAAESAGGAGGGIDRSTGEGVSPGMLMLPLRARVERIRGVELADLVPRVDAALLGMGTVARMAGLCFLREGRCVSPVARSSSLDEAPLFRGCGRW
jgi:hypothetical protein